MDCIQYGSTEIHYEIVRGKRKRTVAIRLDPQSAVTVLAPKGLADGKIRMIVHKKARWIIRRQAQIRELSQAYPGKQYINGESFPYLGRHYRLKVTQTKAAQAPACGLRGGRLRVEIRAGLSGKEGRTAVKQTVREWYWRRAAEKIRERLPRFAGQLGVQAAAIEIRDQKRRWGSCSRSGILRFNWRIVAAPVAVLDYLLVHELCHLIHPDHSLRFWNQVQILIPDFEKKRVLLKEHGLIAGQLG